MLRINFTNMPRELAPDTDLELLGDRLAGPFFHRRFVTGLPLGRGFGEHVVTAVLGTR